MDDHDYMISPQGLQIVHYKKLKQISHWNFRHKLLCLHQDKLCLIYLIVTVLDGQGVEVLLHHSIPTHTRKEGYSYALPSLNGCIFLSLVHLLHNEHHPTKNQLLMHHSCDLDCIILLWGHYTSFNRKLKHFLIKIHHHKYLLIFHLCLLIL